MLVSWRIYEALKYGFGMSVVIGTEASIEEKSVGNTIGVVRRDLKEQAVRAFKWQSPYHAILLQPTPKVSGEAPRLWERNLIGAVKCLGQPSFPLSHLGLDEKRST